MQMTIMMLPEVTKPNFNGGTIRFDVGHGRVVEITATFLTPDGARRLLRLNTRNRNLHRRVVELIKSDIRAGRWVVTGETIKVAGSGADAFVGDAQHRLVAISEGDIAVPVIIVMNIDPAATDIIDQNRTRAVKDILKMKYERDQIPSASTFSAIAALTQECTTGARADGRQSLAEYCDSTFDELTNWATWAKSVSDSAPTVSSPGRKSNKSTMPASAVGALAMHMVNTGGDIQLVRDFFERIASGIISESDKSNVIQSIRKRQQHGTILHRVALADGSGGSLGPLLAEFAVYITAYNRWVRNEPVSIIRGTKGVPRKFDDLPKVIGLGR
jgi:hypothetical protein